MEPYHQAECYAPTIDLSSVSRAYSPAPTRAFYSARETQSTYSEKESKEDYN